MHLYKVYLSYLAAYCFLLNINRFINSRNFPMQTEFAACRVPYDCKIFSNVPPPDVYEVFLI